MLPQVKPKVVRPCEDRRIVEPFWEEGYEDPTADTFGPPSEEILALLPRLPTGSKILDLGCGDGRNALPFAAAGFEVHAIDKSSRGIERLLTRASEHGVSIDAWVQDLSDYTPNQSYDVIITHGVLHLLRSNHCLHLIHQIQATTNVGGWNVHAVFTDRLPQPMDLAPFVHRPFPEGELAELYESWEIELFRSYIFEDEHPGGIRHRHAIDKIVAKRR